MSKTTLTGLKILLAQKSLDWDYDLNMLSGKHISIHQPGPPVGPPTPSDPVLNPYTVQLQFTRQELEREQADENNMLQDRDELARIQSEVNEIRTRRQSAAPTIHQPIPQAPMPPAHQPFLFAPPPQPSPVPLQAPQPTLALPQQRTPTPSETEAVPRRSFLHQGNDPMIAPLLLRFKAVDLKYIKQIYHRPVVWTVLAFSAAAGPKLIVGPEEV